MPDTLNVEVSPAAHLVLEASAAQWVGLDAKELSRITQLGVAAMTAGRLEQARRIFDALARLEPALFLPHLYLGLISEREGDLPAAASHYAEAHRQIPAEADELVPYCADVLLLWVGVEVQRREFARALEVLKLALALSPRLEPSYGDQLRAWVHHFSEQLE